MKDLNLEEDLRLNPEDYSAIKKHPYHDPQDLDGYLEFLKQIRAFEPRKVKKKFYPEDFQL